MTARTTSRGGSLRRPPGPPAARVMPRMIVPSTRSATARVEAGPVGEVPVDHRLRGARRGRDVVHPHAGAVPADGAHVGLDELAAPGEPVLVPPGAAAVGLGRGGGHPADGSRDPRYLLPSVSDNLACADRPVDPIAPPGASPVPSPRRAAVLGGNRIPFARQFGAYAEAPTRTC